MTEKERNLILEVSGGRMTRDEFYRQFPWDIRQLKDHVITEIKEAIERDDPEELELVISLIWLSGADDRFADVLNELLINRNHRSHQVVAKTIQDIKSPSSVPFIRQALQSNFDYLEYTCSESDAIAKWFSWALYSIGTNDAIELMKEYSKSDNQGIRDEMIYRLGKLKT
ncbi:MAG TPA: hypothetical protein VGD40_23465 [Chryseosolibacter sp.]